ncbi:MAG: hypothetical protein L6R42_000286 [Xanthoria sp. 1 TBL-2021]|nr:MAG: hypothetical protein L6R42_000286 [Xanthoria sp. 1 TBL-2021]
MRKAESISPCVSAREQPAPEQIYNTPAVPSYFVSDSSLPDAVFLNQHFVAFASVFTSSLAPEQEKDTMISSESRYKERQRLNAYLNLIRAV